ncbi:MAG: RagB/SusD family nutrient uptake outer membrane protein, partial [Bacteroidia bacterium]|nr:RagB/SusD family nutrient uptake outer membrane protein [Bacteroidia bacterium]
MKKFWFFALIVLSGLPSCKFLDENPTLEVKTEEAIQKPSDVQAAILGAYNYLQVDPRTSFSWADRYIVYADLIDPVIMRSRSTFTGDREVSQRRMTSNTVEFGHLWEAMYKSIEACNAALDVLPTIQGYSADPDEEKALRDQDEAELRFLRAYNYFNLWRMFGPVPLRTKPTRQGSELNNPLPRASEAELTAAIINDLTIAEQKFAYASPADLGGAGRATRLAATAL